MSLHGGANARWAKRYKYYLYTFNVVSLILAIVVVAMAIYIRYDWEIKYYINALQAYKMWTGPYILMASSTITILMSMLGCWGSINENPFLLFWFAIGTFVAAIIGLAGLAYSLNHGVLWSAITPWLTEHFTNLVYLSAHDKNAANVLRIVQENIGCCGGSGWSDYFDNHMPIPHECRDHTTGNMYIYGCGIIFSEYLETLIGWMSGIALLLVVLQFTATTVALLLRRNVLRQEKSMKNNKASYSAVRTR